MKRLDKQCNKLNNEKRVNKHGNNLKNEQRDNKNRNKLKMNIDVTNIVKS